MLGGIANNTGFDVHGEAIRGRRDEQQDEFRIRWIDAERAWILAVADGMGGHAGGALASKIAVDEFVGSFVNLRHDGSNLENAFRVALLDANNRIANAQRVRSDLAGMGTTMSVVHLSQQGVAWISVGDSPLWLFRADELQRLNEDHSLRGAAGAEQRGLGNFLQSALNGEPIPLIDCHPVPMPLQQDDVLLMGSDGILTLTEQQIAKATSVNAAKNACGLANLLLAAVEQEKKRNQDNCTLLVARPTKKTIIESLVSSAWWPIRRAHN